MIILLTYDITDPKRLKRLNKFLKEFGINSQKSVFECDIDDAGLRRIRMYCKHCLDLKTDSVLIYKICYGCQKKVRLSGLGVKVTQLEYIVI